MTPADQLAHLETQALGLVALARGDCLPVVSNGIRDELANALRLSRTAPTLAARLLHAAEAARLVEEFKSPEHKT